LDVEPMKTRSRGGKTQQQTLLGGGWLCPPLPTEVVHVIALNAASGVDLVAMRRVCSEWNPAVTEDAWKRCTLKHFPRVIPLIKMFKIKDPDYRLLYRDQYLAQIAKVPSEDRPNGDERLGKYIFTFEVTWRGLPSPQLLDIDPSANCFCWVGCLRDMNSGVGCSTTLWNEQDPPQWITALRNGECPRTRQMWVAAMHNNVRMRVLVTKRTQAGMTHTLELADNAVVDRVEFDKQNQQTYVVFQSPVQLPRLPADELPVGSGDGMRFKLRPWIYVKRQENLGPLGMEDVFRLSRNGEDILAACDVANYLETFAPW